LKTIKAGDQLRITYHPAGRPAQRIPTTVVSALDGHDLIVVDRQGRLYTTYWTEGAEIWQDFRPIRRRWRRHNFGIFSLGRALVYALTEAKQITMPSIGELRAFCQNHNARIGMLEGNILEHLQAMSRQFTELREFLQNRRRKRLRESREQLGFVLLFRDRLGRINIGVIQARLAAIDNRFRKELEHLCGWTPHYAARLQAVRNLQQQFRQQVRQVEQSLKAMTGHEAFCRTATTDKQVAGMACALRRQIEVLGQLKTIQPFTRWVQYCHDDLNTAAQLVESHNFSKALEVIKRLLEAMKLRLIGFEVEQLIEQIGLDLLLRRADHRSYWQRLTKLRDQLKSVDDTSFVEPVSVEAFAHLQSARQMLGQKKVAAAKDYLKKVAALI